MCEIFNSDTLSVTNNDFKLEINNMSDNEIYKEVNKKITNTLHRHQNLINLLLLVIDVPFTRKHAIMILTKFKTSKEITAYLYRHLVRCAYFYNVPISIITAYKHTKELHNKNLTPKSELILVSNILLTSTLEMIKSSKSRRFKINNIINKTIEKST